MTKPGGNVVPEMSIVVFQDSPSSLCVTPLWGPAMPDVSVIIPLHNKGPYVRETIHSLRQQSLATWELLVVENHSSDNGPELVRALSQDDSRIQLLQAPSEVRGPGAARNHGIERASGKYLLFLDADDLIKPNHLESLFQKARDTGADIVASNWLEFRDMDTSNGATPDCQTMMRKQAGGSMIGRGSLEDSTIAFAPWAVHCALVRKECLAHDRRWLPELDRFPSEDTAFWFGTIHGRRVEYTNKYTAIYRTETVNQRNRHDEIELWSDAMTAVTTANLAYLKKMGREPTRGNCEMLMRLWENIAIRATRARNLATLRFAYLNAKCWLNRCVDADGAILDHLKWRRRLGLSVVISAKVVASYSTSRG